MAQIKHTKNELKAQREALARYLRFLPILLLKKQQLQAEIQAIDHKIEEKHRVESGLRNDLERWVGLFASDAQAEVHAPCEAAPAQPIEGLVTLKAVATDASNIAGVSIPILRDVTVVRNVLDLFTTPPWFDDAQEMMDKLIRLRVERQILRNQRDRIAEELRVTAQRVNLFEKVKIPGCRENIRVIKIFLGDEQTAGVVRGKVAKARTVAVEARDLDE
ncbi:MAG: V-type ATP synthase subunit D [Verrucomicrobiota bacterium]|nr:V-type ATP synthase subunit D [Verrucomicrobiota bacterium]